MLKIRKIFLISEFLEKMFLNKIFEVSLVLIKIPTIFFRKSTLNAKFFK